MDRFTVPEHLAVPADVARQLQALLAPGRAQARANGWLATNERLTTFLVELDRLAERGRPGGAQPAVPVAEHRPRWISTADAAALLGVSERRVRDMSLTGRKVGGAWRWLEADVLAAADARAEVCGSVRQPQRDRFASVDA